MQIHKRGDVRSVAASLDQAAEQQPEAIALVDRDRRVSYAELAGCVAQAATALLGLRLQRYDRVAVYLDKCLEGVVAMLAAVRAGLITVPVNPKLKPAQIFHILQNCSAAALVTSPFRLQQLAPLIDTQRLQTIVVGERPGLVDTGPIRAWQSFLAAGTGTRRSYRTISPDPCAILYTSGSTGLPKGVTVSQGNLAAGAASVNAYLGTDRDDVILSLLPLSFDAGLSQLTTALAAQARLVLHNYLRASDVVTLCARERVTSITGVPPLWTQLAAVPWDELARRPLRLVANTGGHMPQALLQRLRQLFPCARPYLMYGLTEAFRSTYLDPDEIDRRPDSIGKAIPDAEILVLRDDGSPCDVGEPGELVHRGPHVTLGYWNDPKSTAERFRPLGPRPASGLVPEIAVWSGDLVRMDAEGFLYFVGRRDELIKSSGYRISPTEVETVLFAAPGVREAAVFAVSDDDVGQKIVAAVVAMEPPLDTVALASHCSKHLPAYMVPQLLPVEELPRSPNGKIDRRGLAQLLCSAVSETP